MPDATSRTGWYTGAAIALIAVLAIGYALTRRHSPEPADDSTAPSATEPATPESTARAAQGLGGETTSVVEGGAPAARPGSSGGANNGGGEAQGAGAIGATTVATGDASGAGARRADGCNQRFRHCSAQPSDRCETDTQTDVANCGLCHFDCRNLAHVVGGAVRCIEGRCQISDACQTGFADCENGVLDGCEAELASAPLHCGTCNHPCPAAPNATPACQNSQCALACRSGFFDCNGDTADGCEATAPCNGG